MNSSNFGFDCRDNLQNRSIQLIYNKQAEIITKYGSSDDNNCFLSEEHLIKKCNEKYDEVRDNMVQNKGDIDDLQFFDSRLLNEIEKIKKKAGRKKKGKSSKRTKFEDRLEQAYSDKSYTFVQDLKQERSKAGRKKKGKNSERTKFEDRLEQAYTDKSYTFVQDLKQEGNNGIKALACKKQTRVKVSTRFISTKLLINAKMSLASFTYDCIDTFCFPNDTKHSFYNQNKVLKIIPYLLMADTDSASLMLVIILDKSRNLGVREMRKVMLKLFLETDIYYRIDSSHEFFEQFENRNKKVMKQVGLYEFENIEHGIICSINVNPKEYHELYGIMYETNKKQKGVQKGTKGMDFNNYASRILSPDNVREGTNRFAKKASKHVFRTRKVI